MYSTVKCQSFEHKCKLLACIRDALFILFFFFLRDIYTQFTMFPSVISLFNLYRLRLIHVM